MKIGILTSGGDCPGLNAVIRGVVLKGTTTYDLEFVGIRDGWRGVVDGDFFPLTRHEVKGLSKVGGTILGTSRTNPYEGPRGGAENIAKTLYGHRHRRHHRDRRRGHPRRGRPPVEGRHQRPRRPQDDRQRPARDRLLVRLRHGRQHRHRRDGPPAHHGRLAPALHGRRGHGPPRRLDRPARRHRRRRPRDPASPRCRMSIDEIVRARHRRRTTAAARRSSWSRRASRSPAWTRRSATRASTPSTARASAASARCSRPRSSGITGIETRATVLGHIQRGGSPSGFDRVLATRLGLHAADAVVDGAWGQMVAMRGTDIVRVPFAEALGELNTVPLLPLRRGRRAVRLTRLRPRRRGSAAVCASPLAGGSTGPAADPTVIVGGPARAVRRTRHCAPARCPPRPTQSESQPTRLARSLRADA